MKKRGGGKQKGSAFERKMCAALSLWVTGGRHRDCFWRSAMSGGRATVHRAKGAPVRQSGDITAVAPEGHALTDEWFVECKHVRSLSITSFFLAGTGDLAKFWKVAQEQAAAQGRRPMLIAKQNQLPVLVVAPAELLRTYCAPRAYVPHLGCDVLLLDDLLASKFRRRPVSRRIQR